MVGAPHDQPHNRRQPLHSGISANRKRPAFSYSLTFRKKSGSRCGRCQNRLSFKKQNDYRRHASQLQCQNIFRLGASEPDSNIRLFGMPTRWHSLLLLYVHRLLLFQSRRFHPRKPLQPQELCHEHSLSSIVHRPASFL